jgi:outer membrane protein assembly factor BamB
MLNRRWLWGVVCLLCAASAYSGGDHDDDWGRTCEWTQWGQSAAHDGEVCVEGQEDLRILARLTVDPFADQETAETGGSLLVHYPAPLIDDDGDVFVLEKSGNYVSCDPPGSGQPFPCGPASSEQQIWNIHAYEWDHGELESRWTFESDWKALPTPWEPMFQAAMTDRWIYVPGAGGTVFKVDKRNGRKVERINPFGQTVDILTFVSGGITIDRDGDIYYNVVKLVPGDPIFTDAQSWLIKVSRHGQIRMVDYATLIPDAPAADDLCFASFDWAVPTPELPWPPPPQPDGSPTLPPQFPCLSQRAAVNITPAIGRDGTIFTVTRAHSIAINDYAFIVALKPNLKLKWATSMRGHLDDGCGVMVPYGTDPFECREGAALGVNPFTNQLPAGQANDLGSSSPVALPDGGVLYGAFTRYNGFRGHLMKLDRHGHFKGSFDFGWDVTPGIYRHDDTYSIVVKDNYYIGNGPYFVTQLDPNLEVEWQFANLSTETCERLPDDTIECEDTGEHPNGFEWCINAPAIDKNGTVYGLNEDGYMYAIGQGGVELERAFLTRTLAAAYTPLSIDSRGRIYAQNNGELYILGH